MKLLRAAVLLALLPGAATAQSRAEQIDKLADKRVPKVIQPRRHVEQLQLSLHDPPELPWDAASGARVPLTEQVGCRLIQERLNHAQNQITRCPCN